MLNILIDIWNALFQTTYKYEVMLDDSRVIEISAKNMEEAERLAENTYYAKVLFVRPLEDIMFTDGSIGANIHEYETKIIILATTKEEAKKQLLLNPAVREAEVGEAISSVRANIGYYRKGK